MCITCYRDYGSPKVINKKTKALKDVISALYEVHPTGGYLHIVLDDWNLEDGSIEHCINDLNANKFDVSKLERRLTRTCADLLMSATVDERASALAMFDRYLVVGE